LNLVAEKELGRTQINKATTTHIGLLKSQLSKLRTQVTSNLKAFSGIFPDYVII
jgi:uncharacterized protein